MAESQHWSKVGEAGTVFGMRILLLVYRLAGRWGFRAVLTPVIAYYYLTNRSARSASRQYLRRIGAPASGVSGRWKSFLHFMTFGETLLDKHLVWMGGIGPEDVVFDHPHALEKVQQGKHGGMIIVSHLGNTEVACCALAHRLVGIKLTILVYTQHSQKFNRMLKKAAESGNVELIQVTDMTPATAIMLSERIARGEYVIIAGDRTPVTGEQRVSTVDFLGGKAQFPQGPMILASLLRSPVYLMFCLKQRGRYHFYIDNFSEQVQLPRRQRDAQLHLHVQKYAQTLEHYCHKAPMQWFNFFQFWQEKQSSGAGEK